MRNQTVVCLFAAAALLLFHAPGALAIPEDHKFLDRETLVGLAVRANVHQTAERLRDVLQERIEGDGLLVVGAEYSLDTGVVDFFDGLS